VTVAQEKLTRARAWLATRLPFFAVLALHLPEREAPIRTAATDGKALLYNPEYVSSLSDAETRGLVLHLVLHAAFGHGWRRGGRDAGRWERACDIVVNGVIRKLMGVTLPRGADTVDTSLEELAVEAIYEQLPPDLEPPPTGNNAPNNASSSSDGDYWRDALRAATATGDAPGNLERHYPSATSSVSWRAVLERHLVRAQHDYVWSPPDRRMMQHDLVYPSLAGEGVRVAVAVDTSGSVGERLIGVFLAELRALARAHPNVSGLVLYADAAVNAVHDLERAAPPTVIGGGGTSFSPVLRELERRRFRPDALVYLTDGEAELPRRPNYPVIWVLPATSSARPPWGEVVRLEGRRLEG
jgi:predicted metal-dependent peptidase